MRPDGYQIVTICSISRIVSFVSRPKLAGHRRRSAVVTAIVAAPIAVLFAAGGSAHPVAAPEPTPVVAVAEKPCCAQIIAVKSAELSPGTPAAVAAASRQRTVSPFLPAGVAPERGLQVRTILAARSVSDAFPDILQIGGVRADALRWHPNGLAVDVMIPNPGSAEGIALGDAIVAFALENAGRFGLQDAIWRGTYYTPDGRQSGFYGHYDHVHLTTTGGGYPSGAEIYLR